MQAHKKSHTSRRTSRSGAARWRHPAARPSCPSFPSSTPPRPLSSPAATKKPSALYTPVKSHYTRVWLA